MSISRKIREQINQLDVDSDMKDMMLEILKTESQSKSDYASFYEKKMEDYLKKQGNKGDEV